MFRKTHYYFSYIGTFAVVSSILLNIISIFDTFPDYKYSSAMDLAIAFILSSIFIHKFYRPLTTQR